MTKTRQLQPAASNKPRPLSTLSNDELKDHLVRDLGKWVARNTRHINRSGLPMFIFASGKDEFIIQPVGDTRQIMAEMAACLTFTEPVNASILANAVNTYLKVQEKIKSEPTAEG